MRFTRPDGDGQLAHVIIDAGFKSSGEKLIDHVERPCGSTRSTWSSSASTTAGTNIFLVGDGAIRNGVPLTVLPALDETIDDRP